MNSTPSFTVLCGIFLVSGLAGFPCSAQSSEVSFTLPQKSDVFLRTSGLPIYGPSFSKEFIYTFEGKVAVTMSHVKIFNMSDETEEAAKQDARPRLYIAVELGLEKYRIFDSGVESIISRNQSVYVGEPHRNRCYGLGENENGRSVLITDLEDSSESASVLYYLANFKVRKDGVPEKLYKVCTGKGRISQELPEAHPFFSIIYDKSAK